MNEEPEPSEKDWQGRIVNFALYKSSGGTEHGRPLVSKQCRLGNYVTFRPTDKLYFAAMIPSYSTTNVDLKDPSHLSLHVKMEPVETNADMKIFPDAEFSPITEVILADYGHDIQVTLNEIRFTGKLTFTINVIN